MGGRVIKKISALLAAAILFVGAGATFDGWNDEEDDRTYRVVINHEEQYSIWFADRELPLGWKASGFVGTKKECLKHIEEVWTDMRPLSLRAKWGRWTSQEDGRTYKVVVNHEEQYTIWFADRENPPGWRDAGSVGTKRQCLKHIQEVWTDIRPRSLRKNWPKSQK